MVVDDERWKIVGRIKLYNGALSLTPGNTMIRLTEGYSVDRVEGVGCLNLTTRGQP